MMIVNYLIGINIWVHLLLDTIVGKIKWLYPVSNEDIVCFHVPANYGWWVLNFVLHCNFFGYFYYFEKQTGEKYLIAYFHITPCM